MGRQFLPVDRDAPALLPVNMLDWVPADHVVRLVIDTVEAVATPALTDWLGRLTVVAGDGVKIGANASKEANRTEAGLERLAAKILAEAEAAAAAEAAGAAPAGGADLLGGEVLPRGWSDPRSRARRVRACL